MIDLKYFQLEIRYLLLTVTVLVIAFLLTRVTKWLIHRTFVLASDRIKVDPTRHRFFRHSVAFVIWMMAFATIFYSIPALKSLAVTLFAGAGILVAIVGFAAQEAFANIVGGIFLVIFKPFRVGDIIKVGDRDYGTVEDITLRHTVIVSFENRRIIIPNAVMSKETIINDSIGDSKICKFIHVDIAYDADVDKAMEIFQNVCEAHPLSIDNRTEEEIDAGEPVVLIRVISFRDSSVGLRAYVWTESALNSYQMTADINKELKKQFDIEGVEIPFPYRTIVYKNDLNEAAKNKR